MMWKIVPFARDNVAVFAALVGFTVLAAPIDSALGQEGPSVTVVNPATMPALTSSIDDPGRAAYQGVPMSEGNTSSGTCQATFASVPQGHRLVIQRIYGDLFISPTPAFVQVTVRGGTGKGAFVEF
jgi:hypothetical protein